MNKWREGIFSRSLVVILSFTMIQQVYTFSANASDIEQFIEIDYFGVLVLDSHEFDIDSKTTSNPQKSPLNNNFPEQQANESEEESCEEDDLKLLLSFLKPSNPLSIWLKSFSDHGLSSLATRQGKIPTPPPEV